MTDKTITILEDDPMEPHEMEAEQHSTVVGEQPQAGGSEQASESLTEAESDPSDEERIQDLLLQNSELAEQVKRTSAEFQNFSRRQEEEAKRVKVRIREDIIRTMLPVLDNLERTVSAAQQGGDGAFEALLAGVQLIEKDVKKIFGEHGLSVIAAQGEMFDPALHQAVMMEETDEVPDQTILQVLQQGYTLGDRVIRPSMVQVARN